MILPSAPTVRVNIQTPQLYIPQGAYSLTKAEKGEENYNNIFNSMADYTIQMGAHFRQLIRNDTADIYILSYRLLDSLTHFWKPR